MEIENLERSLQEHRFCRELSHAHVEFLAGCAKNARFDPGDYLVREGSAADVLYLLRSGRVALESDLPGRGAVQVDTVLAGEVLGWSVLLPPFVWHLDARALEPTLAFALDGNCLRGKVQADHSFGYAFALRLLAEVSQKLAQTRLQQMDVYKAELR